MKTAEWTPSLSHRVKALLAFGGVLLVIGCAEQLPQTAPLAPPPRVVGERIDAQGVKMLQYSAGDYVIATDRSGKGHLFEVLGHVQVRRAVRGENGFTVLVPLRKTRPEIGIAVGASPLDSRFESDFQLELLAVSLNLASVEEARKLAISRRGTSTSSAIHTLDAAESTLLTTIAVIRMEIK